MSRRRKQLYGLILVLGGVALLADRLLSSPRVPSRTSASPSRSLTALGVEPPTESRVSVVATPFPSALPLGSDATTIRDMFAMTEKARNALLGITADRSSQSGSEPHDGGHGGGVVAFERQRRLTGVLVARGVAIAIVDGQWLQEGDSVDECELTEIAGTQASFACVDGTATLSVVERKSDREND